MNTTQNRFFETTDYNQFQNPELEDLNRDVIETNIKNLTSEADPDFGFYSDIQVNPTKSKGKWVIVDGQNRFVALKRLGMKIPVIIGRVDVPPRGIVKMNTIRKDWSALDIVTMYAKLNVKDYVRLLKMHDEFNKKIKISINIVAIFCQGNLSVGKVNNKSGAADLRGGQWKFVLTESIVRKVFSKCVKFAEVDKDIAVSKRFVNCVHLLMHNDPEFNTTRLLNQAKTHSHLFLKEKTKVDTLRMIDHLYNYKKKESNRHHININL